MADIIPLTNRRRKDKKQQRQKHKTLCRNGFHKWQVWKEKQFDVKQGKLVTVYKCQHCEATQVKAH